MEQSAGGVLYTRESGRRLYVIVTEHDGHTGLPKGHIEVGETPRETALREIREETGVEAELIGDICLEETYPLPHGGEKHVVYYLARFDGTLNSDPTQVRHAALLPLEEALCALTFAGARRILTDADRLLEAMK